MIFHDRQDAGQKLAQKLLKYKNNPKVIVLGLPRGGVVLAAQIANKLTVPLDIVVTRKISAPGNPEFAIGAIAEDGQGVFNQDIISQYAISQEYINQEVEKEKQEAKRRLKVYRGQKPDLNFKNKIVILVDDGIATGSTMLAAIKSIKNQGAQKIIAAIPVSARDSLKKIKKEADVVVCLHSPLFFMSVGEFYKNFNQTEDKEVIKLMMNK